MFLAAMTLPRTVLVSAACTTLPIAAYLFSPPDAPWVKFSSRIIAARISDVEREKWLAGDARPNRIILIRHGQTHGYSHTCDCQVEGLPVCALKPEMVRVAGLCASKGSRAAAPLLPRSPPPNFVF